MILNETAQAVAAVLGVACVGGAAYGALVARTWRNAYRIERNENIRLKYNLREALAGRGWYRERSSDGEIYQIWPPETDQPEGQTFSEFMLFGPGGDANPRRPVPGQYAWAGVDLSSQPDISAEATITLRPEGGHEIRNIRLTENGKIFGEGIISLPVETLESVAATAMVKSELTKAGFLPDRAEIFPGPGEMKEVYIDGKKVAHIGKMATGGPIKQKGLSIIGDVPSEYTIKKDPSK